MGRRRPSFFLSDSGTKMQGEGSGRRPSSHNYEKEALIVTTAVFTKATEFPAGLCASGELRVQYRQFLSLTLSLITIFVPGCLIYGHN